MHARCRPVPVAANGGGSAVGAGKTGWLLVDAPGVARDLAGAELVEGLVEAAECDLLLALTRGEAPPPLAAELRAIGRLFGPPGLADHIASLVSGIRWDRVGAAGPRFAVAEYDGERLVWATIQAGRAGGEPERIQPAPDGVIWAEPLFRVRAGLLDHGIPVLAFALEQPRQFHVRPERLHARGLALGPWRSHLKRRLAAGDEAALIQLPDGGHESAGALATDLVVVTAGQKLVYATDLADTAANRARLMALAQDANVLFCEAAFITTDAEQAARTGHLTARAGREIAVAANVAARVPFHFSRRYQSEPERVYAEIRAVCPRLMASREAFTRPRRPAP